MLQGQKLQQAYDDYINNYSIEKGIEVKSIINKKQVLGKLLPLLNGRPLTFETCREYVLFMYERWSKPNSRVLVIKHLRAFINFLYDRGYITENFSKKLVQPKVVRPPLRLPSEIDTEKCIIAGTEPGEGDNARNKRIKAETRLCL